MKISFLKKIALTFGFKGKYEPLVIERKSHSLSRTEMSKPALKVLNRLIDEGYDAYLVGGAVRDMLLGFQPKDFDIATDALPEEIRKIFRNSRIIGRRFRLVHIYFRDEVIEVSTFRAALSRKPQEQSEMIRKDNNFGSLEEDAWRRDFTINAVYYDIRDGSLLDFTGGIADLNKRLVRMIGDPVQRFHEDPVRMLRAIRLASKCEMLLEAATEKALFEYSHLLDPVPDARLFDELLKLFFGGKSLPIYQRLRQYQFLLHLFPQTHRILESKKGQFYEEMIQLAMQATDERIKCGKSVNPGFLLSVLLWPDFQEYLLKHSTKKKSMYRLVHKAMDHTIEEQAQCLRIPKRFIVMMRSIWILQFHLENRRKNRIERVITHRYYRAAIDFFELRINIKQTSVATADWWRRYEVSDQRQRDLMLQQLQ